MDSIDGNKDAAAELRELGRASLKQGDLESAMRRLSKSQRLYPSPETDSLLGQVQSAMSQGEDAEEADSLRHDRGSASASGRPWDTTADADSNADGGASTAQDESTLRHRRSGAGSPASPKEADSRKDSTSRSSSRPDSTSSSSRPDNSSSGSRPVSGEGEEQQSQVRLVRRVLRSASNHYEVLEISRTSSEEDVKRAYRKLSLRVHPDKNKAPGAEEAFKVVSRAFKCLSDPHLRSNYDTFGHEDPHQQRLQQQQRRRAQHHAHAHERNPFAGQPFFYHDDIDPNDIFNAFFGVNMHVPRGRGAGPNAAHRRAQAQRRAQEGAGEDAGMFFGFLQLLPFLLFLLFFLSPGAEPVFRMHSQAPYKVEMRTSRWNVPFYVKSLEQFSASHPAGSSSRWRVEQTVEGEHREKLVGYCYQEKLQRAQLHRWGSQEQAQKMAMPHCEELRRVLEIP